MGDFKNWSEGWIKEGHFINYLEANVRYYEKVEMRDLLHYEWDWSDAEGNAQTIIALSTRGPVVPPFLEITKGYDLKAKQNFIWQWIFGIQGQVLIYVELPTDTHRHGLPKLTKPDDQHRRVSHFEEWMSPFREPTFLTEHFMMKPGLDRVNLEAYNPNAQDMPSGDNGVKLNFFINSMITERIGEVTNGNLSPSSERWRETLDKLYKGLIPCRPITLYPVRLPATG